MQVWKIADLVLSQDCIVSVMFADIFELKFIFSSLSEEKSMHAYRVAIERPYHGIVGLYAAVRKEPQKRRHERCMLWTRSARIGPKTSCNVSKLEWGWRGWEYAVPGPSGHHIVPELSMQ